MQGEGADLEALAAAAAGMSSGAAAGSGLQPDAAGEVPAPATAPSSGANARVEPAPPAKRRKSGVPKMEADLTSMRVKLSKKKMAIESAMGRASLDSRQRAALEKTRADVQRLSTQIEDKQNDIKEARRMEEAKAKAAEKKEKEKEEKAAAEAHMSEAGAIHLVELVFKYSSRLCNTSDKVEDVWKHIHKDFTAAVQKGDLPETDLREVVPLRSM